MNEYGEDYDYEFTGEDLDEIDEDIQEDTSELHENIDETVFEEQSFIRIEEKDPEWAETIRKIPYQQVIEKEIESVNEFIDKQEALEEKLINGEISQSAYDHESLIVLGKERAKLETRCELEAEGITWDHLGDLTEDVDIASTGNYRLFENKERLIETIDKIGPEAAQELANKRLAENELSEDLHESISRQIRLRKLK